MEALARPRDVTLVWIDARKAFIARWVDEAPRIERLDSDVPSHRKSAGHVRHDPAIRPGGGGGAPATAGEPHRVEHLNRFLDAVATRIPEGDLVVTGPGTAHEHLARVVRALPAGAVHAVESVRSGPQTERQLVAWLRHLVGRDPRRREVPGGPAPKGRRALVRRAARAPR